MSLETTITLSISARLAKALDLLSAEGRHEIKKQIALATGTGAGKADKVWSDKRTIAASATDSIDLQAALVDAVGDAFTPACIKALYVYAHATNTNNVNVTRPALNGVPLFLAAGDGIPVKPGGLLAWVDPSAGGVGVTADTGDLIDLVNSGGGTEVVYDILIIAASATS
jgi:hypothetical protein